MPDDFFGDVDKELDRTQGVFSGSAAWSNQERMDTRISKTLDARGKPVGFDFSCVCNTCGKGCLITLPWIELITASVGVLPADADTGQPWSFAKGFLYPPIVCSCGRPVPVPITPEKAKQFLGTCISMQIYPADQIMKKQQEVLHISQQGRR